MSTWKLYLVAAAFLVLGFALSLWSAHRSGYNAGVADQQHKVDVANAQVAVLGAKLDEANTAYVEAARLRDQYKTEGARAEARLGDALQEAVKTENRYAKLLAAAKETSACTNLKERLCPAVLPY